MDGKTIHRLCKARYSLLSDFMANENNPLDVDILFIDEISMVTKFDFALLLNALPDHAKIICSGDDNQLNGKRKIIPTLTRKHHFVGTNCTIGIRKTA